jgi:tRNA (cytidine/uridine-2'-O-)-methyltransferase
LRRRANAALNVFDIVLFQPEIPPNTGNILRLAANTGSGLHLVKPLGFRLDDRSLRRSGLDYGDVERVVRHDSWADCARALQGRRMFALTTRAKRAYALESFSPGDVFVFGPETRGLPDSILEAFPEERRLLIPMENRSRSLNLSNAVAVVIYEAWRQADFRRS